MNLNFCPAGVSAVADIVIYGLAGNPPHIGHWRCVRNLAERGYRVFVVPSFSHAFGKHMAPFDLRVEWLEKSGYEFGALRGGSMVWDIEKTLAAEGNVGDPVYSFQVLRAARGQYGGNVRLALGPDYADGKQLAKFKHSEEIITDFGVVSVPSAGEIRSTLVREWVGQGRTDLGRYVGFEIESSVVDYFRNKHVKI